MTDPMGEERLAEIAAVVAGASPGPWLQVDGWTVSGPKGGGLSALRVAVDVGDPADGAFIAMARTAMPELLAEVQRQREVVAAALAKAASNGHDRRGQLLAAICRQGGEWTPERTKTLYRRLGHGHVPRAAIRADLAILHRAGHLDLNDAVGRRFYTPTKDGAE